MSVWLHIFHASYYLICPRRMLTFSPNFAQPVIRLYSVPLNAFTGEDEDESGAEELEEHESAN